jgi:hypothetical protein
VAAVVLVTAKHEHLPNRLARAPCNERERTGVRHVNVPSAIDDGELLPMSQKHVNLVFESCLTKHVIL